MTCDTVFPVDFQDFVFSFRGYFFVFFKRKTCELVEVEIYFYEQTKIMDVAML